MLISINFIFIVLLLLIIWLLFNIFLYILVKRGIQSVSSILIKIDIFLWKDLPHLVFHCCDGIGDYACDCSFGAFYLDLTSY